VGGGATQQSVRRAADFQPSDAGASIASLFIDFFVILFFDIPVPLLNVFDPLEFENAFVSPPLFGDLDYLGADTWEVQGARSLSVEWTPLHGCHQQPTKMGFASRRSSR
jgi:hypothetical protein